MTSEVTATHIDADKGVAIDSAIAVSILDLVTGPIGLLAFPVGFFAGEHFASNAVAGKSGVGAQLAAGWPAFELISKELGGKIQFYWDHLTVDIDGVRTTGGWSLATRQPAVAIIGPTSLTYPISHPQATAEYSLSTTDLVIDVSTQIHWTGAQPQGATAVATFLHAGFFKITATVTDEDGYSASGSIGVDVNTTTGTGGPGDNQGGKKPPHQPP